MGKGMNGLTWESLSPEKLKKFSSWWKAQDYIKRREDPFELDKVIKFLII